MPEAEADAVVGDDRHHRAVVDPGLVEAVEQLAEQPVGGRHLEQVALVGLLDDEPARVAGTPVDARQRLLRGAPVDAARRQVLVRHVRQQDVDQVQPRARVVLDLRDELLEAVGAVVGEVGVDADEAVALGLARDQARDGDRLRGVLARLELVLHLVGQQLVADGARHAVPERLVLAVPAQGRRAERGRVLVHVQLVAAAREQAEHVARVIGRDRQALLARQAPVEDRRDGVGRVLVDGGGVAVPGRVAGEPGEVRVAPGVDAAVGVPSASGRGTRRRSRARPGRSSERGRPARRPRRGRPDPRRRTPAGTGPRTRAVRGRARSAASARAGSARRRRPRRPRRPAPAPAPARCRARARRARPRPRARPRTRRAAPRRRPRSPGRPATRRRAAPAAGRT